MNISGFCRWLIVACCAFAAAPTAAQLQPAEDLSRLAASARARNTPVLIAFMQKTCPYCAASRSDYLIPLQKDPRWRNQVLIREIDVDRRTEMRDFGGKSTTHADFARSHGVRRVPTLIVFDAEGNPVAPPIIGLLNDEFYRLYIEQAVDAGVIKMRKR